MINALDSGEDKIVILAANALGNLKDVRAIPSLCATYRRYHGVYGGIDGKGISMAAWDALKSITKNPKGDPGPALIHQLTNEDNYHSSYEIVVFAAGALGKSKDVRAVPSLIKTYKRCNGLCGPVDENHPSRAAWNALEKIAGASEAKKQTDQAR